MENNIFLNLAKARVEIQKKCNKKSGKNKFAGFEYFELKDFLSTATEELLKVGLCAIFNISKSININGVENEVATLDITNGNSKITFSTPTANAIVKGANEIQNLGSKHTYLKRYLYMNALELSESDSVDATIGKDEDQSNSQKKQVKATANQIKIITEIYSEDELNIMLKRLNKSVNDLTVEEASKMIKARKDKE